MEMSKQYLVRTENHFNFNQNLDFANLDIQIQMRKDSVTFNIVVKGNGN